MKAGFVIDLSILRLLENQTEKELNIEAVACLWLFLSLVLSYSIISAYMLPLPHLSIITSTPVRLLYYYTNITTLTLGFI